MQKYISEARLLLALAIPVILAQIAQTAMGFVDTVMAGGYSATDMAAVAIGTSIWLPAILFGHGLLLALSITQLEKSSGIRQILPVIKSLLEKEAVKVKEELKRSYKPRTEARVRLTPGMQDEDKLRGLFDGLARAPKQLAVLMKYIELSGWGTSGTDLKEVTRKSLLEASGASSAILNGLTGKGIFELYYQEVGRLAKGVCNTVSLNPLNPAQQQAYYSVLSLFATKNVCLLHGVTSSGKRQD